MDDDDKKGNKIPESVSRNLVKELTGEASRLVESIIEYAILLVLPGHVVPCKNCLISHMMQYSY